MQGLGVVHTTLPLASDHQVVMGSECLFVATFS